MTSSLDPLFQPLTLRGATLRNRFVMSPMTRGFSPEGVPGPDVADYYRRRAEGDVGLIITEGVGVDDPASVGSGSMGETNLPLLHGEASLAGWTRVVEDVHRAGGLIFPQLWHMGVIRMAGTGPHPHAPSRRPSGVWGPLDGTVSMPPAYVEQASVETLAMSGEDIADVISAYGRTAANARAVGFDGIAIHGAHGYLIDSFLWRETNRRPDAWGRERCRFAAEVVRAVRAAAGEALPIVFRFSQWKLQDYGAQLEQTPDALGALLQPLVDAGVDVFDASTRVLGAPAFPGSDLTLAGWTRKLTGKATMAVGGVGLSRDLQTSFVEGAEAVNNLAPVVKRFEAGEFDLVAVGRSLLVDPHWTRKARAGEAFTPFSLAAYAALS